MELAGIVPAPIAVLVSLCDVGWRNGELGGDLVEGVLGAGEAELVLVERAL